MVKFPCITGRCVIRNVTWSDTVARSDHSTFQNVAPSMAFAYTTSDRRMQFYLCQRVSGFSIAAMSVSRITQVVDKLKWNCKLAIHPLSDQNYSAYWESRKFQAHENQARGFRDVGGAKIAFTLLWLVACTTACTCCVHSIVKCKAV